MSSHLAVATEKLPALARIAVGIQMVAEAVAEISSELARPALTAAPPRASIEMLSPEDACALVAGRDEDGRPRIHERTLTRRTFGNSFRRKIGGKVVYERAGLERWLRTQ